MTGVLPAGILLATDGSEEAATAGRAAADLAARTGAELHLVHAWHEPAGVLPAPIPAKLWSTLAGRLPRSTPVREIVRKGSNGYSAVEESFVVQKILNASWTRRTLRAAHHTLRFTPDQGAPVTFRLLRAVHRQQYLRRKRVRLLVHCLRTYLTPDDLPRRSQGS
jgi:nucleotide-binding universal stress UspA family protein